MPQGAVAQDLDNIDLSELQPAERDAAVAIIAVVKEMRQANDEVLAKIEAKGSADVVAIEKVNRINGLIDELQDQFKEIVAANDNRDDRMDELEKRFNRQGLGGDAGADDLTAEAGKFFALTTHDGRPPAEPDVEAYKAYQAALDQYVRRGPNGLAPAISAALSVGSDPEGGYWITPDQSGRMVQRIFETSPMRQIASTQNVGTDELRGMLDLDEAGSGGWVGEKESREAETDTPEIGEWMIPVNEQYAQPVATQRVLDDTAFDAGAWLEGKVSDRLARIENRAFCIGQGGPMPRGFLTYPAGTPGLRTWEVIPRVNSGAAGAFDAADPGDRLIDMVFGIKSSYRMNARFTMNRLTVGEVRKLKDGQGNYLWQPDFTQRQGAVLLSYPITELEDMPDLAANSLSLAFGDFRAAYQIVDRQGIRVLRDPITKKGFVKFYTTKRVGGGVINPEALIIMEMAA